MYARVSTFQGPADQTDAQIDQVAGEMEATLMPKIRAMGGFKGVVSLVDPNTGKSLSVTLWDSKEAMDASEADADSLREEAADLGNEEVRGVERYRVAIFETA
jgi:heme-degrading monooxygenase HmoA